MNIATSGDSPGASDGGGPKALGDYPTHASFNLEMAQTKETARAREDLELTLGTGEVITPVKSAGVLATLLDTPGLTATFLLAKSPNTSALDSRLDTPGLPTNFLLAKSPNSSALDSRLDTSDLSATFLLAKESSAGKSDLRIAKARAPTPGALDSLLDTSGLPDTFLGSRTHNRPPLGLLNPFSDQVATELSVSGEKFSPLICSESESIEVSSQEFLEGLVKSKGRKTSSSHCLPACDNRMHQDESQNIPRYSFAGLSSSSLSDVSIFFSNPRNPSYKPPSSREEAHNSCLPRDWPKRKPDQESNKVNTVQGKGAPAKHRQKYSPEEDAHLVNFFLAEGCYGERKGVAVWKRVVAEDICPGRTWQSLKERFLKKILLRNSLKKLKVTENALLQASYRSKKPSSSNRYSRKEDGDIVKFIRSKRRLNKASGNMVWKVLAAQDPDKKRSWQSLRGRFLKVLMKREEFGL